MIDEPRQITVDDLLAANQPPIPDAIRTCWRPGEPCEPCAEYQAGRRTDVVVFDTVRAHVCERAPEGVPLPCPAEGGCPCGCVLR